MLKEGLPSGTSGQARVPVNVREELKKFTLALVDNLKSCCHHESVMNFPEFVALEFTCLVPRDVQLDFTFDTCHALGKFQKTVRYKFLR